MTHLRIELGIALTSRLNSKEIIGTSATLCVGSPYVFFRAKLRIRQQSLKTLLYNFETAKDRNLEFRT